MRSTVREGQRIRCSFQISGRLRRGATAGSGPRPAQGEAAGHERVWRAEAGSGRSDGPQAGRAGRGADPEWRAPEPGIRISFSAYRRQIETPEHRLTLRRTCTGTSVAMVPAFNSLNPAGPRQSRVRRPSNGADPSRIK